MQRNEKIQSVLGGIGLGLIVIGAGLYFYEPVRMKMLITIMLGLGFILVVIGALSGVRGEETRLFDKRYTRYGLSTSVALLLIVILLGFAAFLTHRHHYRADMTRTKKYSLSEQTVKVLNNLQKPVAFTCFFEETNESILDLKSLLKEYAYQSANITFNFIDPLSRPDMVQNYGITREGIIILQSGERREETTGTGEVDLTGALLRLVGERVRKVIYFTEGHGEFDPESYDNYVGFNKFKDALKQQNYEVKKISLPGNKKVASDAAALIIAGPKVAFIEDEIVLLRDYLNDQGRILIMLDPPLEDEATRRIPSFDELLNPLGLKVEPDLVIDTISYLPQSGGAIPVIRTMGWHQITKDFKFGIVLPGARSITILDQKPSNVTIETLAQTSRFDEMLGAGSWGEFALDLQTISFDEHTDQVGPMTVAVALEQAFPDDSTQTEQAAEESEVSLDHEQDLADPARSPDNESSKLARIVVLGDADLAANALFTQLGNSDFLLNSINWLCQEEALISIRPKTPESERIFMDNRAWSRIIIIVFLVPVLFLGLGVYSWWRKR
ncbi:GldG family protein [bacterium]|nr:GldG family protein [bacterium]